MYRNLGNVYGEAFGKRDYHTALNEVAYGNYFKRPAETTGGSINITEMDEEISYNAFKKDIESLKPDKIAFSSKKAYIIVFKCFIMVFVVTKVRPYIRLRPTIWLSSTSVARMTKWLSGKPRRFFN